MRLHADPTAYCAQCGHSLLPDDLYCSQCGQISERTQAVKVVKYPLEQTISHWPADPPADLTFTRERGVMLQALPSGTCLTHAIPAALMLGRELDMSLEDALDLSELKAREHGVSRHHCLLQRAGTTLTLVDLGSTNGTYLNDHRLTPHRPITLADGDHLVLGTLHLIVSFTRLHQR